MELLTKINNRVLVCEINRLTENINNSKTMQEYNFYSDRLQVFLMDNVKYLSKVQKEEQEEQLKRNAL